MKFAIFAAGGVGGYFGGRLAQAGHDVTFIARGEHLAAIREAGLKVDSIEGDFVVQPAKATDDPASVGAVDVLLVAVKAWQMEAAIEQMKLLVGTNTIIIPVLNGVEAPEQLSAAFGSECVLGGLCRISAFIAEPGHIKHVGMKPSITFGELDNEKSERVLALQKTFAKIPEIKVNAPDDIHVAMWEKFIFICAISGIGAVTRQPVGIYRSLPETRAMLEATLKEALKVGEKRDVPLANNIADVIMERIDKLPEGMTASMQKDVMEGNPSELEAQNGALVRMGRKLSLPVPTHEFIYASLLPQELQARDKRV
ncbi:MAG: ketopantoate reductase family protein [Anaerolineales bacterium]